MATKIGRTATSSTNATKFTWSAWVKRANIGSGSMMIYNYLNGDNRAYLQFQSDDKIYYYDKDGGDIQASLTTTAVYRDPNAFYHICLIGDSTDSTQADRIQLYVNGVRQSMSGTYPDASDSLGMKVHTGTNYHVLGTNSDSTSNPFQGIMSHVHYVDGIDYPATTFGSTDSTTGEWRINTSPSITASNYGNNGYFVLKDGNSVTDQSGNSHNFTVTAGTLTKTEDCPNNVFATLNGVFNLSDNVLSYGNTKALNSNSNWKYVPATLGVSSGKFYAEYKVNKSSGYSMVGVVDMEYAVAQDKNNYTHTAAGTGGVGIYSDNGERYIESNTSGGSTASYAGTFTTGDIIGVALDMDNNKVYFSKNGDWANGSGAWGSSTFNSSTGAITLPTTGTYTFSVSQRSGAYNETNFGNGYFGTTQVSSAGTNASSIGIFEYDVPTGYTALSTKGLNE